MPGMEYLPLSDGSRLAYDWQPDGDGAPLVFLNGILMNLRSWKGQSGPLAKIYPCLLHDLRGQLYSSKVFQEKWAMEDHLSDLKALLDALEIERCHLIGTSYGGEVGLLFAEAYPERVQSLSVIASVPWSDALLKRQVRLWRDLAEVDRGLLYDAVATCSYSGVFLERTGTFFDSRKAEFAKLPDDFFTSFMHLCDAFLGFNMSPETLAGISCPTLLIGAGSDVLKTPAYSRIMEAHIPNATYTEIPGAGHAVVVEQPKTVTGYLKAFIEKHA